MDPMPTRPRADFRRAARDVFVFFLFQGRKARKTQIFYLLSFLPVVMALIIKFTQVFQDHRSFSGLYIFSNIIITFYLQFLILLLALFFGVSVCSEELENRTLPYLTTRPLPKPAVILGKYAAYLVLAGIMTGVGAVLSFIILNLDGLQKWNGYSLLLRDVGVLWLGLMCYTAFFTLIGSFLRRSVMFGLIFSFGWENVIQYFPGSTQKFAIAHYLKSLLPVPRTGRFNFLVFRLEATPPLQAVLMLMLLTAVFLGLACLIFTLKEYVLED